MDRMGPKWFTDINPRFASPVKNHILCFVLSQILLVIYSFSSFAVMQNVVVTGLQVTSVFLPTAIAALLFPYMKRARGIWESSPYKRWTFLDLPVVVWGALVDIAYLLILLYVFIFNDAARQFTTALDHPLRRGVGAGRRLVLHLEAAQQDRRRGRVHDLRRVAAGVISHDAGGGSQGSRPRAVEPCVLDGVRAGRIVRLAGKGLAL